MKKPLPPTAESPRFPELVVELSAHAGRPIAMIALVRRALQKSGHDAAAVELTEAALGCDYDELLAMVRTYVTVV